MKISSNDISFSLSMLLKLYVYMLLYFHVDSLMIYQLWATWCGLSCTTRGRCHHPSDSLPRQWGKLFCFIGHIYVQVPAYLNHSKVTVGNLFTLSCQASICLSVRLSICPSWMTLLLLTLQGFQLLARNLVGWCPVPWIRTLLKNGHAWQFFACFTELKSLHNSVYMGDNYLPCLYTYFW